MLYLSMFLIFVYFGLICFGGGSSLMPFYIDILVDKYQWLTLRELGDFVAIAQVTPGPIGVNLATFLGYRQGGFFGGLLCTAGLLLPSWILMTLGVRSLDKWEKSKLVRSLMYGVKPATMGLIAAAFVAYLEISIFKDRIPWEYCLELLRNDLPHYSGPFGVRYDMLPVFAFASWMLYKNKLSIMKVIFISAALGAVLHNLDILLLPLFR